MPNETKPFGQVKCALMGAVVIIGLMLGNAVAAEWPLQFPAEKFKNIPSGQGMRFFHGVWQPLGRHYYGLTKTVTVTPETIPEPFAGVRRNRLYGFQQNDLLKIQTLQKRRQK